MRSRTLPPTRSWTAEARGAAHLSRINSGSGYALPVAGSTSEKRSRPLESLRRRTRSKFAEEDEGAALPEAAA